MNKTLKKVWDAITTTLVAVVVIMALLMVGARFFGYQVFAVISGSMEPEYPVGSLIYVKSVDPFELEAGDVITYLLDEDTVSTHRVMGVVPDENDPTVIRFRTKGDANDSEDATLVHYKNVIGTPVFKIPKLGYISEYIKAPPGRYVAISAVAILILLMILPDLFSEGNGEDSNKKQKNLKKGDENED